MPEWNIPGYTGLKRIGAGGFGEVVLARHDASGALVAIKYLRADLLADQEFAEMFRGEAAVLASLQDPNVVRLYEYVESPHGAAIVMELVSGVSLREILTYQGKTTAEAALVVLDGSLRGLAAAHRRGVVHRDYKPENVLVNGDGISKLTDFGIAARTGDRPVPAGTLHYAAPEQMAGAPARPASDVYAATATFYECLTGRPPFHGEAADLIRQHRSEPVPLEPVPEPLRPLVAAGMAKDPADRPTDATTFVTELATAAARACGRDWHDRGRSHLGEAALLLAMLWPSGPPPTAQATAVQRIPLRRRVRLRHLSPVKAAIAAGVAIAAVAAGTALAATGSSRPAALSRPVASVQSASLPLSPSSPSSAPATTASASTSAPATPSTASPAPAVAPVSPSTPAVTQTTPTATQTTPTATQTTPGSGPPSLPTGTFSLENYNSGECLGIAGGADDANAIQWDCNGAPDQTWHIGQEDGASGYYQIVNGDGECLGVYAISTTEGEAVVGWECLGTAHPDQYWAWAEAPGDPGYYYLVDYNSGQVVGVVGNSTTEGAFIVQWANQHTPNNQLWRPEQT